MCVSSPERHICIVVVNAEGYEHCMNPFPSYRDSSALRPRALLLFPNSASSLPTSIASSYPPIVVNTQRLRDDVGADEVEAGGRGLVRRRQVPVEDRVHDHGRGVEQGVLSTGADHAGALEPVHGGAVAVDGAVELAVAGDERVGVGPERGGGRNGSGRG